MNSNLFREIPKVDQILKHPLFISLLEVYQQDFIVDILREELSQVREDIKSGNVKSLVKEELISSLKDIVVQSLSPALKRVINGTGIVLNTGLGRAPLGSREVAALLPVLENYCSLEYDLQSGTRGRREDRVDNFVQLLTKAEAATVVNNNAAAVMIVINTLSQGKKTLVSRGELVEIGGSFRMPDVIVKAGAVLKEVGTTNKTHLSDFNDNIDSKTGLLAKIHTSNYRINGFTEEVSSEEMVKLSRSREIPFYYDLGGGVIDDFRKYGLPYEPYVNEVLRQGADLVSFSGDKVLGGPQAGIIAGKREFIEQIKKNPLMRVLRLDKVRLALLEQTLHSYFLKSTQAHTKTLQMLTADKSLLLKRAEKLASLLRSIIPVSWGLGVMLTMDQAGSGTLPTEKITGAAVWMSPVGLSLNKLSESFRLRGQIPIIGFINADKFFLSVRALLETEFPIIRDTLMLIIQEEGSLSLIK